MELALQMHGMRLVHQSLYTLKTVTQESKFRMASKVKVYVVGVGMTKFVKPGKRENFDYPEMAGEAVIKALDDAKIQIADIVQACVGYVYGDSTCGQRALYQLGMTSLPVYNVNNNCATGSTALLMAKQIIESGNASCVLALGFEKMERGALSSIFLDRANPLDKHVETMAEIAGISDSPILAQMFGNAAKEHMEKHGTNLQHLAKIAYKNHKHSVNNPYAQFQEEYSLDDIINSPNVFGPLTRLQCCPTSDGAAAAILANEDFVHTHQLEPQAVEILGMEMCTDLPSTFYDQSCIKIVGYDMTKAAADKLFAKTGYSAEDVDVIELHDCFSANELITYEALGLCSPGKAGELIDSGNNTYGGKYVINPSGGLISKGHPLGATGLAQCAELCWQLRGLAGRRQVPGAKVALQHNIGLGGAVVVALYKLGFPDAASKRSTTDPSDLKAAVLFRALETAMQEDKANLIENVRGVYCFKVKSEATGKEGYWIVNAKTGKGSVEFNGKAKPDVTIIIDDADVVDLISGKLNPQRAFLQGKVKILGNIGLALKLIEFQKHTKKRIAEIMSKL